MTQKQIYEALIDLFRQSGTSYNSMAKSHVHMAPQGLSKALDKETLSLKSFLLILEYFKIKPSDFFLSLESKVSTVYSYPETKADYVESPGTVYRKKEDVLKEELIEIYRRLREKDEELDILRKTVTSKLEKNAIRQKTH